MGASSSSDSCSGISSHSSSCRALASLMTWRDLSIVRCPDHSISATPDRMMSVSPSMASFTASWIPGSPLPPTLIPAINPKDIRFIMMTRIFSSIRFIQLLRPRRGCNAIHTAIANSSALGRLDMSIATASNYEIKYNSPENVILINFVAPISRGDIKEKCSDILRSERSFSARLQKHGRSPKHNTMKHYH